MRMIVLALMFFVFLVATPRIAAAEPFLKTPVNTVIDCASGLEWLPYKDGDTFWPEGEQWAKKLGQGWRMPTSREVATLYTRGSVKNYWGAMHVDRVFYFIGRNIWSGDEANANSRYCLDMLSNTKHARSRGDAFLNRTFAVRKATDMRLCTPPRN
ncbi:MAG: hypothetical protein HQL96_07700 [Magnetococcales bacterium]|nr:hypothetical protein [Magnetococcales bacterium]